jgi:hypothetical protein
VRIEESNSFRIGGNTRPGSDGKQVTSGITVLMMVFGALLILAYCGKGANLFISYLGTRYCRRNGEGLEQLNLLVSQLRSGGEVLTPSIRVSFIGGGDNRTCEYTKDTGGKNAGDP